MAVERQRRILQCVPKLSSDFFSVLNGQSIPDLQITFLLRWIVVIDFFKLTLILKIDTK